MANSFQHVSLETVVRRIPRTETSNVKGGNVVSARRQYSRHRREIKIGDTGRYDSGTVTAGVYEKQTEGNGVLATASKRF